jgi:hypothetical protein
VGKGSVHKSNSAPFNSTYKEAENIRWEGERKRVEERKRERQRQRDRKGEREREIHFLSVSAYASQILSLGKTAFLQLLQGETFYILYATTQIIDFTEIKPTHILLLC